MIKFTATNEKGEDVLGLGLSAGNCRLLMEGRPIVVQCSELGLPPMEIVIMGGQTEQAMFEELERLGVLDGVPINIDNGPLHPERRKRGRK